MSSAKTYQGDTAPITNHASGAEWHLARCGAGTRGPVPTMTDRAPVTCKRCLASLAKRDREFRAKARLGLRRTWLAFALRGEAYRVSGYWDRDSAANATRAIAREEGRAL
jgi:hypothetical protein